MCMQLFYIYACLISLSLVAPSGTVLAGVRSGLLHPWQPGMFTILGAAESAQTGCCQQNCVAVASASKSIIRGCIFFARIHACIHGYIYIYIYTRMHTQHTYIYVCIYVCVHLYVMLLYVAISCTCVYMHVCLHRGFLLLNC